MMRTLLRVTTLTLPISASLFGINTLCPLPAHAEGNPTLPDRALSPPADRPISAHTPILIAPVRSISTPETQIALESSPVLEKLAQATSIGHPISHPSPKPLEIPAIAPHTPIAQSRINQSPIAQATPADLPSDGLPTMPAPPPLFDETKPPALDPQEVESEVGTIKPLTPPTKRPPQRPQPTAQLLLRSSVFTSSNISALRDFNPSDTVFVNGATLLLTPKLGDSTRLIASAGGGFVRFANRGDSNYNQVAFNVAIQQRLAAGTCGQIGWVQDNLYRADEGDRLLHDNAVQFIVGRQDTLGRSVRLDTTYELRAGFSNPSDQSRLDHNLGVRLRYDISPQLQAALDYRLTFRDYTQVDRFDTEHQISALAIYNLSPDVFISGNVSYLFGRSSAPNSNPNNLSIGISLGVNVPLF